MGKECCKYHDKFFLAWIDKGVEQPTDLNECGYAGVGPALLCCENCPLRSYYVSDPTKPVKFMSQRRPVEYLLDVIEEERREKL